MSDSPRRVDVLRVPVDVLERCAIVERLQTFIESGTAHYIIPMNPIKIVASQRNAEFRDIIINADMIVPESSGVRWALRCLYGVRLKNTPGFELMQDIIALACKQGYKLFFVGTSKTSMEGAIRNLRSKYVGLEVIGFHDGFFQSTETSAVVDDILRARPHILLVGMGVFLQEEFIRKVLQAGIVPLCMGVGGSFDVLAGIAPRAPQWLCDLGFEWLYRLARQPKRIKPMLALPKFVLLVLRERIRRATGGGNTSAVYRP
jgi:N-acetylglucosaminyldiphosphoundecaprenol N-acetyl-beta-D-mannosaminyltransferase